MTPTDEPTHHQSSNTPQEDPTTHVVRSARLPTVTAGGDIFGALKKGDFLTSVDNKTVSNVLTRLRAGVEVKTRTRFLRTYPDSFVGGEAVSWMIDHIFTQTREEAVWVGQMLLNHGALQHASLQGAPFADGRQFYQFLQPEAYATNRSGFLGIKYDSASSYRLRHLYWYDKPYSIQPLGYVFLKDILLAIPFPSLTAHHAAIYTNSQCEFEMHIQSRVLTFMAKDPKEMKLWVELLYPFTIDAENERMEQAEDMLNRAMEKNYMPHRPFAAPKDTRTVGKGADNDDDDVRFNVEKALIKERGRLQLLQLRREMQIERKESKRLREQRELQRAREFRVRPEAKTTTTTTTTTTTSIKQTTLVSTSASEPDDDATSAHAEAPPQQRHHRPQLPPLPLDGRRNSSPRQQRGRSHSWAEREHPRDLQAHDGLEGGSVGPAVRAFPWLIDAPMPPSPRTRSISAEYGNDERAPSIDDDERTRVYFYSFDDEEQHQQQLTTMLYREVADDENALELTEVMTAVSREASATAGPESEVEVETGGNESWPLEDSRKWLKRRAKGKEKLDTHYGNEQDEDEYADVVVANGLVEYASSSSFPPLARLDRTPDRYG